MAKRATKKIKEAPSDSGMFTSPGRAAPVSGQTGSTGSEGMMHAGGTSEFDERTGQPTGATKGGPTKQAPITPASASESEADLAPPKPLPDTKDSEPAPEPAPASAPESEGVTTFTFFKGVELGDANPDFLYKRGEATQVTEAELREYFNAQGSGMLKRAFGDFDNYLAYMTEREQLIQSGDYDVGNWDEATGGLTEDQLMILEGEDLTQYSDSDQDAYTEAYGERMQEQSAAYDNWVNSEANQALLAKYGVGSTIYNNDGDKYEWNGSAYVKTVKQDQAGLVDYVKMGIVTAIGIMSGGAIAPALSGGAAAGTAASVGGQIGASVLSNAITQAITTGSIDPDQLLQTAATAGFGQALNQVIGPALSEAMGGLDLSEITGIEELDNVLNAMGQTAIRQAVFDGQLDMDQIVSSGLFTGAMELVDFVLEPFRQNASQETIDELNERALELVNAVGADAEEANLTQMISSINTAIADQQNEAMRNQLQALAGNLQSIYEEAYDVSPQPSGPSLEDFMASSVDDADSELADTTADLTTDTTVQPEPMAEIKNPFEGDELINGVYYNDAGFPVGISPDATPEQILEQFVNDKNAWTTTSGVSAHGLPPEAIAVLMQDGDLQGLSDLLVENNLILAQDSGGGYILISGSEATTGFHTSLDQDALLNLDPPSNERIVPPPTSTDPALDPMDTSDVSPEIRDILLDVQEAPTAPLETEVEVEPFEYEEEPELTPEPPPEPEPEIEPVEQQEQEQAPGEAGTASPSPDPTTQPDPSFTPAPTPAPQPAPAPAPAPAPSPQPEPEPEPERTPQEEAPITTGMFEEYFPPAPSPAPAPAPAPPSGAPPAAAPAPAPSASAPPPPAPGTATGTTPEGSVPATTDAGTGSGTGAPAGEAYEQGSMIGDARALIEQALLNGATTEYLQENFPQYSDIITEVSNQLGTVLTQQPSVTTEDVEGIVNQAVNAIPEGMTPEQVSNVVNEAIGNIEFPEGMTASEVSGIVDEAIANIQFPEGLSAEDVNNIVENAIFGIDFPESATMQEVNQAISDAGFATAEAVEAGQAAAAEDRQNLQQAIIAAQGDISQLDESTRQQFEEFGGTVNELFSNVNVDIEALQAGQISQAEAQQAFQQSTEEQFGELGSQVGDLGTQIGGLASDVSGIGQGLEGIGQGIAGIGEGLGAGLLGLAAQQAMLPGQMAAATPIQPQKFEKFQRGLTRRKLADPLRIGMFTGGARSV